MAPYRLSLSALIIGLSVSQLAWPLGFGDLQLQSELNQPLRAEIPVLGVPAYAADSVKIRLGKREDFAALGYDYSPEIDDVSTVLQVRENRLVLQLSSRNALREPLLNLVLVAEEGATRYLRDYAVLLDLPGTAAAKNDVAIATLTAAESAQKSAEMTPAADAKPADSQPSRALAESRAPVDSRRVVASEGTPALVQDAAVGSASETLYGPTRSGESLSTISHRLGKARGDEWHAFGVALYHANREAFIAGDPNRLKAAMPLKIPTQADVQRFSRRDWQALFAAEITRQTGIAVAAQPEHVVTIATSVPQPSAGQTSLATSIPTPASSASAEANLQQLKAENIGLKMELQTTTSRLQALEEKLSELDGRYAELSQRELLPPAVVVAPVASESAVNNQTLPVTGAAEVVDPAIVTAPVTVQVNDTLAVAERADAALIVGTASDSTVVASNVDNSRPPWRGVVVGLLVVFLISLTGVLVWQWSEYRQQKRALKIKPRANRQPRPVLPLADAVEAPVPSVGVDSLDRRTIKLKQVQAALETYITYQRFDRALELLEQEMHVAGDDLMLRRQLQRLQKQVRQDQAEWQQANQDQLSDAFDRATVTHVDKPAGRDDSKKTSG